MKFKKAGYTLAMGLMIAHTSANAIPFPAETCVGSPWQICWGGAAGLNYGVFNETTLRLKSINGRTYNNIQLTWKAEGTGPTPVVISRQNCMAGSGTVATGCIIYPDATGIVTGVGLQFPIDFIKTTLPTPIYLYATVSRQNADGTFVNMIQTRVGPLYINFV